jgi:hypothetical protein
VLELIKIGLIGEIVLLLTVDKVDGPWVIIEWGKDSFRIPKYLIPGSVKEGDELNIQVVLRKETSRLRRGTENQVISEGID